jgi:hypothetical protein
MESKARLSPQIITIIQLVLLAFVFVDTLWAQAVLWTVYPEVIIFLEAGWATLGLSWLLKNRPTSLRISKLRPTERAFPFAIVILVAFQLLNIPTRLLFWNQYSSLQDALRLPEKHKAPIMTDTPDVGLFTIGQIDKTLTGSQFVLLEAPNFGMSRAFGFAYCPEGTESEEFVRYWRLHESVHYIPMNRGWYAFTLTGSDT